MIKKIALRLEGGIGDHLCSIRFLPAIRELYPDCEFYGFSDTENNHAAKNLILALWPTLFKNIEVIPTKKDKHYTITHQFGTEKYIASFDNIPDEYRYRMTSDYDKFYDLQIDGLHWMNYDFNWSKYFYQFLPIEINLGEKKVIKNQIAINLYSDSNAANRLDTEYVQNLIKQLAQKYSLVILATDANKHFYDSCAQYAAVVVNNITNVAKIIQNSALFLTLDSGLKFLGYSVNTPTINFLSQITEYGNLPVHQYIRWNPFIWSVMPLHYPISNVQQLIEVCSKYNTNLIPGAPLDIIDNILVKRNIQ
jgi:ADP-heptose:LPS heptosyltransferase